MASLKANKRIVLTVTIGLLIFMTSCITISLNPIYNQDDLVSNDTIVGDWIGAKSIWTFTKEGELSYRLSYKECAEPEEDPSNFSSCTLADFRVKFIKINGQYFADFYPIDYSSTDNQMLLAHLRAFHSFAKIEIIKNELKIAFLDNKWMEIKLDSEPKTIDHLSTKDGVILTATTEKLQDFINKYSKDKEAFSNTFELKSKK